MEFIECDYCKSKPGAAILCESCYQNRKTIYGLEQKLNQARKLNNKLKHLDRKLGDINNLNKKLDKLRNRLKEANIIIDRLWIGDDE